MTQRNVLLIMVDQVIASSLEAYGGICGTPNLASLAQQGIRFDNAYTTITLCSPARGSVFTGLYPHRHGVLYNTTGAAYGQPELTDSSTMITKPLKAAGVRCGYAGKWHVGSHLGPREYGFEGTSCPGYGLPSGNVRDYDEFLKEKGHPGLEHVRVKNVIGAVDLDEIRLPMGRDLPDRMKSAEVYAGVIDLPADLTPAGFVAGRTIEMLEEFRDAPFCLTAAFWGPHHPAFPCAEFAGLHDPEAIPEWANYRDELGDKPRIQARYARCLHRRFNADGWPLWQRVVAAHFDFMSMIDAQVGRILEALDSLGLAENTVVLFTSDHGDTLGCHGGQWDKGPYMFEETCRVPLIARGPGLTAGVQTAAFVSNMDIYATALELCGAEVPAKVDARSFVPLLDGKTDAARDCVMGQFYGFDIRGLFLQRMLRMGDWKYVYNPSDTDELYNLAEDPAELINLIADPAVADSRARLQRRLADEMALARDPYAGFAASLMGLEE